MLDVLDAAYFDPVTGAAYFFAGDRFVEYAPGAPAALRTLGVDRWPALPDELRGGIDAALYYPPDGRVYLFRGDRFVAYGDTAAPPLAAGRLGVDGWHALPAPFRDGIDTVFYCRSRGRLYWVRGDHYLGYTGDDTVAALADWKLPFDRVDAILDYRPSGHVYCFRARMYARWQRDDHPPRRIGSPYGRGLVAGKAGGWLGLSCIVAGPHVGPVTATTATIWVWTLDLATVARLRVRIAGVSHVPAVRDLVEPALRATVDGIHAGSQIVALVLAGLEPARAYAADLALDDRVLDHVAFRTAPAPADRGTITIVAGSCAETSKLRDAPVYERMVERAADVAIFHGDCCYYVNHFGSSSDSVWRGGFLGADWDDPRRMLLRQLAARNHPQLAAVSRSIACYATWDDHDFGYNNGGGHDTTTWAGRVLSSAIFRAMWAGPYVDARSLHHRFRTGPVDVFVTDNRYEKQAGVMLGSAQLAWLLDGLATSDAPVKVLVVASQFLYRRIHESFCADAPAERAAILETLARTRGRTLVLSGDVHYCELLRAPATGTPQLLELTSSGLRTGETADDMPEWEPGTQVWAIQADAFAAVTIAVRGWAGDAVDGAITIEVIDDAGTILRRTVWNLADGSLAAEYG